MNRRTYLNGSHNQARYPFSFSASVKRSNGAKVLTFTNLTSDSLSLYQDPKNAGAVFQVPFSDFDCYRDAMNDKKCHMIRKQLQAKKVFWDTFGGGGSLRA